MEKKKADPRELGLNTKRAHKFFTMDLKLVGLHDLYCLHACAHLYPIHLTHAALVSAEPMSFQMLKEVSPQDAVTIQQV